MSTSPTPAINIQIYSRSVLETLRNLGEERQGPFILSRGLNLLAKKVQANLRIMETNTLNLKRKPWVLQQVKIMPDAWSSKTRLKVTINLSDQARFMSRLETGQTKTPMHSWLMVPNAKVFKGKPIKANDNLNIKKLNLHDTPFGIEGDQRTFKINTSSGTPLILQRVGKDDKGKARRGIRKSTGIRLLYYGIKEAKIPRKMSWYNTAEMTVATEQYDIFRAVIEKALSKGKK